MEEVDTYRVLCVQERPGAGAIAVLTAASSDKELPVPGRYLEAQFKIYGKEILLLSQGGLHDELLDIYLLEKGEVLEHISLSDLRRPSSVGNIETPRTNQIGFELPAGQLWQLSYYSDRVVVWPLQACVSRNKGGWLRSHITLERVRG